MLRTVLLADTIWLAISLVVYVALYFGLKWWRGRRKDGGDSGHPSGDGGHWLPGGNACMHCPQCGHAADRIASLIAEGPCVRGNILCRACSCARIASKGNTA